LQKSPSIRNLELHIVAKKPASLKKFEVKMIQNLHPIDINVWQRKCTKNFGNVVKINTSKRKDPAFDG